MSPGSPRQCPLSGVRNIGVATDHEWNAHNGPCGWQLELPRCKAARLSAIGLIAAYFDAAAAPSASEPAVLTRSGLRAKLQIAQDSSALQPSPRGDTGGAGIRLIKPHHDCISPAASRRVCYSVGPSVWRDQCVQPRSAAGAGASLPRQCQGGVRSAPRHARAVPSGPSRRTAVGAAWPGCAGEHDRGLGTPRVAKASDPWPSGIARGNSLAGTRPHYGCHRAAGGQSARRACRADPPHELRALRGVCRKQCLRRRQGARTKGPVQ